MLEVITAQEGFFPVLWRKRFNQRFTSTLYPHRTGRSSIYVTYIRTQLYRHSFLAGLEQGPKRHQNMPLGRTFQALCIGRYRIRI